MLPPLRLENLPGRALKSPPSAPEIATFHKHHFGIVMYLLQAAPSLPAGVQGAPPSPTVGDRPVASASVQGAPPPSTVGGRLVQLWRRAEDTHGKLGRPDRSLASAAWRPPYSRQQGQLTLGKCRLLQSG